MLRILPLTLLLCLLLLMATGRAIGQNCEKLTHYRDVELVAQFDAATKKYKANYRTINEAIADAKKYKEQLLSEKGWDEFMSIGTAISDGGVKTAQIAAIIKTYCDLFSGVMEMIPGEDIAATAVENVKLTVEQTYSFIKAGKDLKEIVEGNLETIGYKNALDQMNIAGKAVKTAMEFQENLTKLIEITENKEELKSTVERILNIADDAILKYKQKLEKSKVELNEQIAIEQGITKYLKENCREEDEIEKSLKKELAKTKKYELNPINQNNSYTNFMYFSASFIVPADDFYPSGMRATKRLIFISNPISYTGDFDEAKPKLTIEFESKLKQQMPDFRENTSYELKCNVYNGPSHDDLIKSLTECESAIQKLKQMISDGWRGDSKRFTILQLK